MVIYQPQPKQQHSNQSRTLHLWNNFSILQTQKIHLNPSNSWSSASIFLIWPENILMHVCSLKLRTERREHQMSKLVTNHWEKDEWRQGKIQRKIRPKSAWTLKGIGWLKSGKVKIKKETKFHYRVKEVFEKYYNKYWPRPTTRKERKGVVGSGK